MSVHGKCYERLLQAQQLSELRLPLGFHTTELCIWLQMKRGERERKKDVRPCASGLTLKILRQFEIEEV